jgi:hypothetical protein
MLESVEAAVVDMQGRLAALEELLEELREREGSWDENRPDAFKVPRHARV